VDDGLVERIVLVVFLVVSVGVVFVVAVFNVKYLFQFNERNCELEKNVKNVKETELEHAWTPEPVKDTALRKMHGGLRLSKVKKKRESLVKIIH